MKKINPNRVRHVVPVLNSVAMKLLRKMWREYLSANPSYVFDPETMDVKPLSPVSLSLYRAITKE